MAVIPMGTFIAMVTNSQKQKKGAGGRQTVWTPAEEKEMRAIAEQVILGNCSVAQCVVMFKQQLAIKNQIGGIRSNKSYTAFKKKLARTVREMKLQMQEEK